MRYAKIIDFDVANGEGVGCSLFVQGCPFHCKGCFNPETWNFNSGSEFTKETEDSFYEICGKPYIKRITILGGEPLSDQNVRDVYRVVFKLKYLYPDKSIWLFTGYAIDDYLKNIWEDTSDFYRINTISRCDYVVDGRFIESKHSYTLKFKGSTNQRVINIKESIKQNQIIQED